MAPDEPLEAAAPSESADALAAPGDVAPAGDEPAEDVPADDEPAEETPAAVAGTDPADEERAAG